MSKTVTLAEPHPRPPGLGVQLRFPAARLLTAFARRTGDVVELSPGGVLAW